MVQTGPSSGDTLSLDDARLIREMASGDSGALSRFYDRWSGDVYAIAIAIVRVPQDAEEIVEDVFWQAWNQASRFDSARGQVRQWIASIARSRALDRLKSVKRRREEALESAPLARLADAADASDALMQEENVSEVTKALLALPQAQREVVEMAYYGGLSQSEIAQSTGEPIGTIKTRTRLGMQKLRESMGDSKGARA
jgi:RNA polymerase sigma-70 factor (ECF subfamily)